MDPSKRTGNLSNTCSNLVPTVPREVSLQAYFTFVTPSCLPQDVNSHPGNRVLASRTDGGRWRNRDGSECSFEFGGEGVTFSYASSAAPCHTRSLTAPLPLEAVATDGKAADSSKPSRSCTFSGTSRGGGQRQYGRRCKSTAHIILKRSDDSAATGTERRKPSNMGKIPEECPRHLCCSCPSAPDSRCPCHLCTVARITSTLPCSRCLGEGGRNRFQCCARSTGCGSCGVLDGRSQYRAGCEGIKATSQSCQRSTCTSCGCVANEKSSVGGRPQHTERIRPQDRKGNVKSGQSGVSRSSHQDAASKKKSRPRTIHIDVYCSSSSDEAGSTANNLSSSEEEASGRRLPHTLVALGSKSERKNELLLKSSCHKTVSSVRSFSSGSGFKERNHRNKAPQPAFITDMPNSTNSTPQFSASDRAGMLHNDLHLTRNYNFEKSQNPCERSSESRFHPQRPNKLNIPKVISPPSRVQRCLSDAASSIDETVLCEGNKDMSPCSLSWRGSEFDTSLLNSCAGTESLADGERMPMSEIFYEGDSEGTEVESSVSSFQCKLWRSPKLERKKYIQLEQEQRYRNIIESRRGKEIVPTKTYFPSSSYNSSEEIGAPGKLSVYKDDSVIHKAIGNKNSTCSLERKPSFRISERADSLNQVKPPASFPIINKAPLSSKSNTDKTNALKFKIKRSVSVENKSSLKTNDIAQIAPSFHVNSKKNSKFEVVPSGEGDMKSNFRSSISSSLSKSLVGIPGELVEDTGPVYDQHPHSSVMHSSSSTLELNSAVNCPPTSYNTSGRKVLNSVTYSSRIKYPKDKLTGYSYLDQERKWLSPYERMFVRPQIFGEVSMCSPRRPIHFGPPRNPQCLCDTCRRFQKSFSEASCQEKHAYNNDSGTAEQRATAFSAVSS